MRMLRLTSGIGNNDEIPKAIIKLKVQFFIIRINSEDIFTPLHER